MPRILKLISVRHLCDVLLVTRRLLIPRKYHIMFITLKEGSHQLWNAPNHHNSPSTRIYHSNQFARAYPNRR